MKPLRERKNQSIDLVKIDYYPAFAIKDCVEQLKKELCLIECVNYMPLETEVHGGKECLNCRKIEEWVGL